MVQITRYTYALSYFALRHPDDMGCMAGVARSLVERFADNMCTSSLKRHLSPKAAAETPGSKVAPFVHMESLPTAPCGRAMTHSHPDLVKSQSAAASTAHRITGRANRGGCGEHAESLMLNLDSPSASKMNSAGEGTQSCMLPCIRHIKHDSAKRDSLVSTIRTAMLKVRHCVADDGDEEGAWQTESDNSVFGDSEDEM